MFITVSTGRDAPDQLVIEYKLRLRDRNRNTLHKTSWTEAILESRPDDPNTFDLNLLFVFLIPSVGQLLNCQ